MSSDRMDGLPSSLQRPRSKYKLIDLMLDAAFSLTGPAQVSGDGEGTEHGPRTPAEAQNGCAQWRRVSSDGHTYLVERKDQS